MVAAWTLGGLGATYLIKAVDIAVPLRMHPEAEPKCLDNLDQIMLDRPGILLARWLTRRGDRLAPTPRQLTPGLQGLAVQLVRQDGVHRVGPQ